MSHIRFAQKIRRAPVYLTLSLLGLSFFFWSPSAFAATRSSSVSASVRSSVENLSHTHEKSPNFPENCGDTVEDLSQFGIILAQSCLDNTLPTIGDVAEIGNVSAIISYHNQTRLYSVTQWYACTVTMNVYDVSQDPYQQSPLFTKSFNCLSDAKQGKQQTVYDSGPFFILPTYGHTYCSQTQVEYSDAPEYPQGGRAYIYPNSNAIPLY